MMNKESKYINVKGQLMDLSEPRVMGILNVTPDSFYSESRLQTVEKIAARVVEIVNEGADILRVHDVKEAVEAVRIVRQMKSCAIDC